MPPTKLAVEPPTKSTIMPSTEPIVVSLTEPTIISPIEHAEEPTAAPQPEPKAMPQTETATEAIPQTKSAIGLIFASMSMPETTVSFFDSSPSSVFQIEIPQVSSSMMLCLYDNLSLLSDSAVLVTAPLAESTAYPMISKSKLGIVKSNPQCGLIGISSIPREPRIVRSALLYSG